MPPQNPASLRNAGRKWLEKNVGKRQLARPVVLIPGLCNEDGAMWDTIDGWGSRVFGATWKTARITFPSAQGSALMNFVDLGGIVRDQIAASMQTQPYDLLCYSMGGLDAFAALLPISGGSVPPSTATIGDPITWVTLDTPFFGVVNWEERKAFGDMFDPPGTPIPSRQAQCTALAPNSPPLAALRAARPQLGGRVQRITCYCCTSGDDVTMVGNNGDLCLDVNPDHAITPAPPWSGPPEYRVFDVPGATHAGAGAIYENEWAIACAFADLLGQ